MAHKLTLKDGKEITFQATDRRDSREAECVYLKDFTAYKIFTSKEQATKATNNALAARTAGVSAIGCVRQYEAVWEVDNQTKDVHVMETERCIGTFFQLAKPGHVKIIVDAITTAAKKQPELIKKSIRGFEAANKYKLTDPQGFFDFTQGMPIKFLDIHVGSSPAPQLQEVVDKLSKILSN
jgi:hypothetical protein